MTTLLVDEGSMTEEEAERADVPSFETWDRSCKLYGWPRRRS
jgi:hypothetical protein